MKVIITGGEGFIGKALALTLKKRGIEVISVDRLNGMEAGEYFMSADLNGISCVYHLAAQTSVFNKNKSDIITLELLNYCPGLVRNTEFNFDRIRAS